MGNLIDLTVKEFVKEVDSDSPAPGGGSVSSVAAAVGCALARMVGHLTFGKKKYEALDEKDKDLFSESFSKLKAHQDSLEFLVDEDTRSFGIFMKALKLPKDSEEEKQFRLEQMEEATKEIIKVPYEIATESLKALKLLTSIIEFGNKNAITDVGVAALLLSAGIEGAILNVKINLPGLSDVDLVSYYKSKCLEISKESTEFLNVYQEKVNSYL
ncbi:MAG: cyclodeaminase/cyclohydrolase family protein [Bacilli bacterium]